MTDFATRIKNCMDARFPGTLVFGPDVFNLVYVEGADRPDGTPNANRPDAFDSIRVLLQVLADGTATIIGQWDATTHSGRYYEQQIHWLNPGGPFHIATGPQTAWTMGQYHGDALVQVEPLYGTRDVNMNYKREGPTHYEIVGAHHHHGGNLSKTSVGAWAAGCQVARMVDGHQECMDRLKTDRRYVADPSFLFTSTVLPVEWLAPADTSTAKATANPTRFDALKPEYVSLLSTVTLTNPDAAKAGAQKVIANKARYIAVSNKIGVPWALIGALDLRESDCDPDASLGQGDPWREVSQQVPAGFGPFSSWEDAAIFYMKREHVDVVGSEGWTMPMACFKAEGWNGWGYRDYHHVRSPYVWAGTNHQQFGKYIGDGEWSSGTMDKQLGVVAVLYQLVLLAPESYIGVTS
jgi:lysozyme family protein